MLRMDPGAAALPAGGQAGALTGDCGCFWAAAIQGNEATSAVAGRHCGTASAEAAAQSEPEAQFHSWGAHVSPANIVELGDLALAFAFAFAPGTLAPCAPGLASAALCFA